MPTTMKPEDRAAFLNGPWVAVISIPQDGRGPLTVPVWYYYDPGSGDLCVWTDSKTRKARLLEKATRISICVQDQNPPYRYASAEGPFSIEPVQYERDIKPMSIRFLGAQGGEQYLASIGHEASAEGGLLVRLHPQHWLTGDYSGVITGT